MPRTLAKIKEKIIGVACSICSERHPVEEMNGCSRCGESFCTPCKNKSTLPGKDKSRICPTCSEEIGQDRDKD